MQRIADFLGFNCALSVLVLVVFVGAVAAAFFCLLT